MSTNESLARSFKALAHSRRTMVFRLLAERPDAGNTLDKLRRATRLSHSSLVHHLREMERCGLIRRHRRGAEVAYRLTTGELTMALAAAMRISEVSRHRPRRAA